MLAACSGSRAPPRGSAASSTAALPAPLNLQLVRGESLYFHGEYDSAHALLSAVDRRADSLRDTVALARARTWLGLIAYKHGDYVTARRLGEAALALKQQLGLKRDLFRSYNALGLLAWMEGRLKDALTLFDSANTAASAVHDTAGSASASGNRGLVLTELGSFGPARRDFLAARDGGRLLGNARIEGNALNNLGMLAIRSGDPQAAVPFIGDARRLYRSIAFVEGEQNALGQLGTAYAALGQPQQALAALDSALSQSRHLGLRQEEASNLEAMANLYRESGDYRRALELYGSARSINDSLGLAVEGGADLTSMAEIHEALGDTTLAERDANAALHAHTAEGAKVEEIGDLLLLAGAAGRRGRAVEATDRLQAARRLAAEIDAPVVRTDLAIAEAEMAERDGDASRVLRVLATTGTDRASGGFGAEWEIEALRARALARQGRFEVAADAGRRAVAAVERVRGQYGSGILRTSVVAERSRAYGDLIGALEHLGRTEEAFAVSDAARGRALLDHLVSGASGDTVPKAPVIGELQRREAMLREIGGLQFKVDSLEAGAADAADTSARGTLTWLRERLSHARGEYELLLGRTSDAGAAALGVLGSVPVRASDVRHALRPDERLLEYFVAPDRVDVFVVAPEWVRSTSARISSDNLLSRVRLARALISRSGGDLVAARPALAALYQVLVGEAHRSGWLDGAHRLIIVPHAALQYLSFAALVDSVTGRYLAQDFALVGLPSAGALPVLRSRAASGGNGGEGIAVFAPLPDELPASRDEADAVRGTRPGVVVRLGRQANEANLREALRTPVVVHVATHGSLNTRNPLFSWIDLARSRSDRPEDDGRLEVHEVLDVPIRSPLVFLSGCETGLGASFSTSFAPGEDFATLGEAFLYAGAQNVVATLWRVDDAGAARFAERFYRHLADMGPVEALAAAQRDVAADPQFRAPYYWAGYVLMGGGEGRAQSRAIASVQRGEHPW
jgi:CHAT domain-containing protein/tetratricopeptide (TPR) repeat protein